MKISLRKHQGSVSSLDFVEEHQSRLRVLKPSVLPLAYIFHETIWIESIAEPARRSESVVELFTLRTK